MVKRQRWRHRKLPVHDQTDRFHPDGRTAVGRVGMIDPPPMGGGAVGLGAGGMGMEGAEGGEAGMMGGMMEDGGMGMGMEGSEGGHGMAGMGGRPHGRWWNGNGHGPMTTDPANGRYVDAAYKPLTGGRLAYKK